MPGQGCEIGIPLLHNDLPQCANTWINPAKSREMRTDVRTAHEIGPRKRRGGKKWECQCNPAGLRGRIRNEWGEMLLDAARGGCVRRRNRGRSGKSADKPGSVERHRRTDDVGQSFLWAPRCRGALAAYPGATRATPMLPYLALPRMGFAVPVLSPVLR